MDSSISTSFEEDKPKTTRKTEVHKHRTGHITRVCSINFIIIFNISNLSFRFYQHQLIFHLNDMVVMIQSVLDVHYVKSVQHYY